MSDTFVETSGVRVTADLVDELVRLGGYTHPLFRSSGEDPSAARRTPLPGQAVLLLAGGLVEQSGLLDDALALLEIRSASFAAMVRAGDEIRVRVTPGEHRRSRSGRVVQEFGWQVLSEQDNVVATATVVMLVNNPVEGTRS